MPPKGKGKGGQSSKSGWKSDGNAKAVTLKEFLACSGVGTTSAGSSSVGGVGADAGALQTLVAALTHPSSQLPNSRSQGSLRTIKLESIEDERRLVAAYTLLKEKEAEEERHRIAMLVDEGVKARLGSPEKDPAKVRAEPKRKKAKVDIVKERGETSSETEGPESPDPKQPSRGSKHRKKKRDELSYLRETMPALLEFKDTMMEMLTDDRAGGSDDESAGARAGGAVLRQLRRAHRSYQQATPSPLGKVHPPIAMEKPSGESSGTKTASRDLQFSDLDKVTTPSDSGSGESTKMKALLSHFAPPTPSTTKKPTPKKLSPLNLFKATLDSLKGAGLMVDKGVFPTPTEKYAKTLSKTDIEMVTPIVRKLTTITDKAAKAMKINRVDADLAAKI